MSLNRHIHAAVLLLFLTQSLISETAEYNRKDLETFSNAIIGAVEVPWIEKIDFEIHPEEDSCAEEIATTLNALKARKTWALKMLDASSKIQSGMMEGNLQDLGTYDQCIKVNGNYNSTNVQGKYCRVSYGMFSSAVCVPSSCNGTQISKIADTVIKKIEGTSELQLEVDNVSCPPVTSEIFTFGEITATFFILAVVVFIVFCTICELLEKYRPASVSPVIQLLAKFSLYTNAIAILRTEITSQMIPAIEGMRFLTMCWIIFAHHVTLLILRLPVNRLKILDLNDSYLGLLVQAAPFTVDTFFVISGFLMSYLLLRHERSGKKINFIMLYLHRYLRLTPSVAVIEIVAAVLFQRLLIGPFWQTIQVLYAGPCRENWWINLLYIQNILKVDKMCVMHTWFLAVDMQLFWISPIILYPLRRFPRWGPRIFCLIFFTFLVTSVFNLSMNGYRNSIVRITVPIDQFWTDFWNFHISTYNRACAYLIGIYLGYDAAKRKRNLSQINVAVNWTIACILMLFCILAFYPIQNTAYEYDTVLETVLVILLRPFWSIAIAWILYACTFGYGGAITRFLSLPIFLPLGRLSYCIYLAHILLQGMNFSITQTSERYSIVRILHDVCGDIILSIAAAFILSLFFEAPIVVLLKNFNNRRQKLGLMSEVRTNTGGNDEDDGKTTSKV